jgi:hypothetical protein
MHHITEVDWYRLILLDIGEPYIDIMISIRRDRLPKPDQIHTLPGDSAYAPKISTAI